MKRVPVLSAAASKRRVRQLRNAGCAVRRVRLPDGSVAVLRSKSCKARRLNAEQLRWTRKSRARVRRDNPPAWVRDEPTWEAAKAAVRPYWGNYSDPWAVVAHVYHNMGGS